MIAHTHEHYYIAIFEPGKLVGRLWNGLGRNGIYFVLKFSQTSSNSWWRGIMQNFSLLLLGKRYRLYKVTGKGYVVIRNGHGRWCTRYGVVVGKGCTSDLPLVSRVPSPPRPQGWVVFMLAEESNYGYWESRSICNIYAHLYGWGYIVPNVV